MQLGHPRDTYNAFKIHTDNSSHPYLTIHMFSNQNSQVNSGLNEEVFGIYETQHM